MGLMEAVAAAMRFYSRLPVPVLAFERAPYQALDLSASSVAAAVAIAGMLLGAIGGAALWLASTVGLPPLIAALLALVVLVLATGALHEDGLADMGDSLGGRTREQRLEIMRDSRIGSYGVIALVLSLGLRAVAMAVLLERAGAAGAALVLVAAASVSRVAGLLPLLLLTSARTDGAAAAVRPPTARSVAVASACAIVVAVLALSVGPFPLTWIAVACAASFAMSWGVSVLARSALGGYTGDVAGAAQQVADVGMLLTLVLATQHL